MAALGARCPSPRDFSGSGSRQRPLPPGGAPRCKAGSSTREPESLAIELRPSLSSRFFAWRCHAEPGKRWQIPGWYTLSVLPRQSSDERAGSLTDELGQ